MHLGCTIRTHLLWAATQLPVYFSEIWARGGSRRGARSEGHSNDWAKAPQQRAHFCAPKFGTSLWGDTHTDGRKDKSEIGPAGKTRLWEIRALRYYILTRAVNL